MSTLTKSRIQSKFRFAKCKSKLDNLMNINEFLLMEMDDDDTVLSSSEEEITTDEEDDENDSIGDDSCENNEVLDEGFIYSSTSKALRESSDKAKPRKRMKIVATKQQRKTRKTHVASKNKSSKTKNREKEFDSDSDDLPFRRKKAMSCSVDNCRKQFATLDSKHAHLWKDHGQASWICNVTHCPQSFITRLVQLG